MLVMLCLVYINLLLLLPLKFDSTVNSAPIFPYQVQEVQTNLPYHQLMTPKWIHGHAIVTGPHALYPQYVDFLPVTGAGGQRFLQLQLVPPNILTSSDSVTVTITIAVDNILASSEDHDPSFGISDGTSFVGFVTNDRHSQVCRHFEGTSGLTLTSTHIVDGPTVTSGRYSSEIKIQIRPTEKWGSCHTEHDEGYTNIANYQHLLDLTKGLHLEMYRGDPNERYRIKYMLVDISVD